MPTSIRAVRGWHAALAVVAAFAVVGQVVHSAQLDRSVLNTLSYFTIQSNLLVAVGAALVALDPMRRGFWTEAVRLAGLVGITVTGVVYAALLAGTVDLVGADVLFDLLLHRVVPVATLVGFLFLRPRTELGASAWWFLAWPLTWLVYTLVRAEVSDPAYERPEGTSRVPYDFIDRHELGWGGVTAYSLVILAVALLLAWGFVRVSRAGR